MMFFWRGMHRISQNFSWHRFSVFRSSNDLVGVANKKNRQIEHVPPRIGVKSCNFCFQVSPPVCYLSSKQYQAAHSAPKKRSLCQTKSWIIMDNIKKKITLPNKNLDSNKVLYSKKLPKTHDFFVKPWRIDPTVAKSDQSSQSFRTKKFLNSQKLLRHRGPWRPTYGIVYPII